MVAHVYNPRTHEAAARGILFWGQPGLPSDTLSQSSEAKPNQIRIIEAVYKHRKIFGEKNNYTTCLLLQIWVSFIQTAQDLGMFQVSECLRSWDICVDFTQLSVPKLKIKIGRCSTPQNHSMVCHAIAKNSWRFWSIIGIRFVDLGCSICTGKQWLHMGMQETEDIN